MPAIQPLVDAIRLFDEDCIEGAGGELIALARAFLRSELRGGQAEYVGGSEGAIGARLTRKGAELLLRSVAPAVRSVGGSYFGMLQGIWPLHLLRSEALPAEAFESDEVRCRVVRSQRGEWSFIPIEFEQWDRRWFSLEFSLPEAIAELVEQNRNDPFTIADLKQDYFSYIDLTGVIGGIRRSVRLRLDREWIERYVVALRSGS